MALDFSVLTRKPTIADSYNTGQQEARQEAEQNMLRQMQIEQRAAQRENMLAQRQEQAATVAQRQAQESRLAQSAEIEREIKTLDYAARRLFGATPKTYQSIRADLSRINPQFGAGLPAEYDEEQVMSLAMQGRTVKEQIEAATGRQRYMSTPYGPFDTEANEFRMPETLPARAPAAGAAAPSAATPRPPSGYRFTDSGNLEAIPGGPAARNAPRAGAAAPAQPREPREPSAPIAVVDPTTGKPILVSRAESIQNRMTPASAMEGLAPKEIQRREAVFPKIKQSVATIGNTMTTISATVDRLLKNKKGLNGITGLIYGNTPAITNEARAALTDLETLKNLAFVQGLTELRSSSTTGAGVGNVSNREGDRFESLKTSLNRIQSYADMVASLKRLDSQAKTTKTLTETEFADMYEYKQRGGTKPSLDSIFGS